VISSSSYRDIALRQVPLRGPPNAFLQPDFRLEPQVPQLAHVWTAPARAAGPQLAGHDADLTSAGGRHQMGEVVNRNLAFRSNVVNAQPFPLLEHPDQPAHEIVDVDEGARLLARALNGKIEHAV